MAPAIVHAQAAIKLDLATVWPDSNFHTVNAKAFAEEVKKATNGAVEISVKAGGQLGFKGPEQLRAVRDGLVPMADILNIQQVGDEPMLGIEGIPFISNNIDELKILHKHIRPEYEKIAIKNNQTILYMVTWPTQYLHLKVKCETLDALKGIKIRVPDKNAQEMCSAIGMAPALIPWGETIAALSSGAVAGVSTSSVSGVDTSKMSLSSSAVMRCTVGGVTCTASPGTSSRPTSVSPSLRSNKIRPAHTKMVSSLRLWYCRLSAWPALM